MKKLKIIVVILTLVAVAAFLVYRWVNKPIEDFSQQKPAASFSAIELLQKAETDTAALALLRDKLIAVSGNIRKVTTDSGGISIELGDTVGESSVVCQIDARYVDVFKSKQSNEAVHLKGILRSFGPDDTGLGLGTTVQMNYCINNQD